jgi:hypothetical protein
MDQIESHAREGRITAVAVGPLYGLRYVPAAGAWVDSTGASASGAELRALAAAIGRVITITADLPANVSIGGPDRQPLLDVDPDVRAVEVTGDQPTLPRPFENEVATFRIGAEYVEDGAAVLLDGVVCEDCSFTPAVAPGTGKNAIDMTIDPGLPRGVHVVQVLNPNGWASNEMPICVTNVELGRALPPAGEEACKPEGLLELFRSSAACASNRVVQGCACQPGAEGAVRACTPNHGTRTCDMTVYCFGPGGCSDATVSATCGLP